MKISVLSLASLCLLIASMQCQAPANTTTLQVEDQINAAKVLETIPPKTADESPVSESSAGLMKGEDEEDDESEDATSSMIPNANNTIAKIVEAVASNMTANIKPSVEEVKIPMDLGAVLDKVGQQMFLPEGEEVDNSASGSRWVQSVPKNSRR